MKKIFALMLTMALLFSCAAFATETTEETQLPEVVYVSITDDTGTLVVAYEPIELADTDEDGLFTINDALLAAHIALHEEGAEAYASVETEYGISLAKLWNIDNGGVYGYYLNDASAWSLFDPIVANDHVKAFCYTDLETWSDTYAFFDAPAIEAAADEEIALTLSAAGYDETYAPITLPVEGAVITVNGEATEIVTDAEGKAVITLTIAEDAETVNVNDVQVYRFVISATSETQNLVAPVCVVTIPAAVEAETEK